jgi:ABC-2 type transport system permease protein
MMGIVAYVSIVDEEIEKTVGIIDETGVLYDNLIEQNSSRYLDVSDLSTDSVKTIVLNGDMDGYIILNEQNFNNTTLPTLVYGGSGGISFIQSVESDVRNVLRDERLARSSVSDEVRAIFETQYKIESVKLTEDGEEEDNAVFGALFGFILGLLIFMGVFGYGAVLMRSVIEEKTNRIVEVIASSVKPIELMIGKLLGVCVLAITQFAIWILAYIGLSFVAAPIAATFLGAQTANLPDGAKEISSSFDPSKLEAFVVDPIIFIYFIVFFIIGFMIYAAIFAAVGAAVDSEQDTQQFMTPVMVPIMIGYFFNLQIMKNPDSVIAVVSSLIPLTAPINMISRIAATEVPMIQILGSLALMILTFIGLMWLAAKIYRVGILMYGKKPSYKELAKWIRQG